MPIRSTFDSQLQILFTRAEGVVSLDEIQSHLDEKAARQILAARELLDASGASTNLTADQVRQIAASLRETMGESRFGPTAVVAQNDVFLGMANMLATLCGLHGGPEYAVFRSIDAGLDWLVRRRR